MTYTNSLNPVALDLGIVQIRWYGVMYVLGFLFVYWYIKRRIQQGKANLTLEQLDSVLSWMVAGMIIGARVVEVLYYSPGYYFANPAKIIAIWEGGLSFHGALIGVLIAGYWYCRKHGIKFWHLADLVCVPISLANAFGRIGNFFNGELYGYPTNLPWGVIFPTAGDNVPRHPTMLYEALYDVVLFAILWKMKDRDWKDGKVFGWFLIIYGVFRTLTEFLRVQDNMIGPLTPAQWLNVPMLVAGIWLVWRK